MMMAPADAQERLQASESARARASYRYRASICCRRRRLRGKKLIFLSCLLLTRRKSFISAPDSAKEGIWA